MFPGVLQAVLDDIFRIKPIRRNIVDSWTWIGESRDGADDKQCLFQAQNILTNRYSRCRYILPGARSYYDLS